MLDAQRAFGPHDQAIGRDTGVAIGRNLYRLLPEDQYDAQPLRGGGGRLLLVADIRIDNRDDLTAQLGICPAEASRTSDAALLLRGFERWGEDVFDRIAGDFAVAIWDGTERRLILARDPLGGRPLHYHQGDGFVAFSSMPQGLHALDAALRRPDQKRVAEFVADLRLTGPRTFHEGIARVETGYIVTVGANGLSRRSHWNPKRKELRLGSDADYVEAFRAELDRATAARLRRAGGAVAAHLSSGYDSSAVAATAARVLERSGERLPAFTAAPRAGFDGPAPRGRIADESGLAAATAALHSNIDHHIVRPAGVSPFGLLNGQHALIGQPIGHICNGVWLSAVREAAAAAGASVLLTGQAGNHTISAGGRGNFADLLREGRWLRWLQEARATASAGAMRWRGIFDNSFGPWTPLPLHAHLRRSFLGAPGRLSPSSLLAPGWTEVIERRASDHARDPRPPRNSFAAAVNLLRLSDPGNYRKAWLASHGLDERDPTADRRLVDFCLSLPIDQLLKDGRKRPLARRALSDRLPSEVLDQPCRGYQGADWYEQITEAATMQFAEQLTADPAASAVIDFGRVRDVIEAWPAGDWDKAWVINEYRMALMRAMSAAHFLSRA